ncbi:MAG: AAA family ATPase [Saprospiraceae bacterium]|nr:AAA family ATPase [Saprospiraceae bacterium]
MITKLSIKNFKKLEDISFDLSQSVVIIGPNNSGKSTIFQALSLWETGVTLFLQAAQKNDLNTKGYVPINRRDLLNSPIADARFLWRNKKVTQLRDKGNGQVHIPLEVTVHGNTNGKDWICKAEFTFSNAESLTCRITQGLKEIKEVFRIGNGIRFRFLQPMSGLSSAEDKLTQGSIDRKLGEGKTAEVLRNICFEILYPETQPLVSINAEENWLRFTNHLKNIFGATLHKPEFIRATGIIQLEYTENGIRYDVSSGGRGFLQTLLLLAYMYANPGTIMLLDEPDAHLEVIRQREIFKLLGTVADEVGSQMLIASHSEVVLNEAVETSKVVALIENRVFDINTKITKDNVRKALTEIGWEKYYLARLRGHVLYLEGSTDLDMLKAFAQKTTHPVAPFLLMANIEYVGSNVPGRAVGNFEAFREFIPQLKGLAIFDRIPDFKPNPRLDILCWRKRELENYFAKPEMLIRYARFLAIFRHSDKKAGELEKAMDEVIKDITAPAYLRNLNDPWWSDEKLTDNWLDKIFPQFYEKVGLPQAIWKRDYHEIILQMKPNEIDTEIKEKLDALLSVLSNPTSNSLPDRNTTFLRGGSRLKRKE